MLISWVLVIAGVILILCSGMLGRRDRERRAVRLVELRNGADEAFFEERRSLEAYSLSRHHHWGWVFLGAAMILYGVSDWLR